jgi:hypothetical protein
LSIPLFDFVGKYKEIKAGKAESYSKTNIIEISKLESIIKSEKTNNFFRFTRIFNRENSIDKNFAKTPIPTDLPKVAAPKTAPTLSSKAQAHLSKSKHNSNFPQRSFSSQNLNIMN